jgi:hypothetical protein
MVREYLRSAPWTIPSQSGTSATEDALHASFPIKVFQYIDQTFVFRFRTRLPFNLISLISLTAPAAWVQRIYL